MDETNLVSLRIGILLILRFASLSLHVATCTTMRFGNLLYASLTLTVPVIPDLREG